jgi:hypothetical protein
MDFDLNKSQRDRLESVGRLIEAAGSDADVDQLDKLLMSSDALRDATVLDRFLVAEELGRHGLASGFGVYSLVRHVLPDGIAPGRIAVTEAQRSGPVRFGDSAAAVVILDGEQARVYQPGDVEIAPTDAVFGYPFAHVKAACQGIALPDGSGRHIRALWRLALTAEIAGNARSAIARTADHLQSRAQFGRPLASFQALRHRLADAAVSAEAASWLGREAAFDEHPRSVLRAAWYASATAAALVPELMQMCGARSFTLEFGLHLFTMRMVCLRLELGGIDRLSDELSASTPQSVAGLR